MKRIFISIFSVLVATSALHAQQNPEYADFNWGQTDNMHTEWVQAINIVSPACRDRVSGKVTVKFTAPDMDEAHAFVWAQPCRKNPSRWGHDVDVTPKGIKFGKDGVASFTFNADKFPDGPMNVRIYTFGSKTGKKDYFELQLFNEGGEVWNQGIPDTIPAAAKGMQLIFEDDFDGPLSISRDGKNATYNAHKPGGGDFSGWQFADPTGPMNPFFQEGTWLKIAARKPEGTKGSSGLIAPVDADGNGVWAGAPCYIECKFVAQSATGTWPAFWTLNEVGKSSPYCDELDVVEAYGGVGPRNPNHPGYSVTSHYWNQKNENGERRPDHTKVIKMMEIGSHSYFSTTFHTYGLYVGLEDTVYYLDDIEVFRHPTNDHSLRDPLYFLINYAIGGISGWHIDLERYGNGSDMFVDYVRVFAAEKLEGYNPYNKKNNQ